MYEYITELLEYINNVIWGLPTIFLLVSTGLYLSIKLRFFQILKIDLWVKNTIFKIFNSNKTNKISNTLSPFQTFCTALSSTIGTGNIAGVAAAVSVGGPGAIFWMWVSAIFGMMTSYSENILGIYFRKKNEEDQWMGGPMVYIKEGFKNKKALSLLSKPLSVLYCIFLIGASIGIGNMVQTNSISESLNTSLNIPGIFSAFLITVVTYIIISGGLKRIGGFTEKVVPFMSLFYIGSTLFIFVSNSNNCSYVFASIIENAFCFNSVSGAACGVIFKKCISTGFKRGVFSNEAGLGASVTVNSLSNIKEPCEQGMWGIFAVFTDTIIICTLTAFALLSTTVEAYNIDYAIKNLSSTPSYVYLSSDENNDKATVHITDNKENFVLKAELNNNKIRIVKTDKKTYTNIMQINGEYDEHGKLKTIDLKEIDGVSLVSVVFKETFGKFSTIILTISIVLFSFSTVIGWNLYGTKAVEFLSGTKNVKLYNAIYIIASFIGSIIKLSLVWTFSDIFNGLMVIPNLIAILALSPVVKKVTINYLKRLKDKNIKPITDAYSQ